MARPPDLPQPGTELEEFFDLSIDPLSIIGFDGKFKRVNESFVRLLGYSRSELFSRTALDNLHPDDLETAREALAQLAEGHDVVGYETRIVSADGAVHWLEWNTRSMPERGVLYGVARDTTERRRVEAELREAQRLLEASRDELRVLAEEQAALRRVATLVAREAPQADVFAAIAEEIQRLLGAEQIRMVRYEDEFAVVVGSSVLHQDAMSVGSRHPLEGDNVTVQVFRTGRPARIEDYTRATGKIADTVRLTGIRAAVGTPIAVDGRLWGAMVAATSRDEPLPPGTEMRLGQFTDLMATAIANTESHARADRLADEQATLRHLATLVAQEAPLEAVFAKVADDVARTLGDVDSALWRDDGDGTVIAVAVRGPSVTPGVRVGTRLTLDGDSVIARVLQEGRTHRIDDFSQAVGSVAERARELGMRSAVGCPIVVGSRTWGAMTVATYGAEPFAPETETRVARFSDLVTTAIANAETRAEVERLAREQAALRRVATLVAAGVEPADLFSAVSREVAQLFGTEFAAVGWFDPDGPAVVVVGLASDRDEVAIGTRLELDDKMALTAVHRTGRAARVDRKDWSGASAPVTAIARRLGAICTVASPIVVEGHLWGCVTATSRTALPLDTEDRLADFTELVGTAIANAESRARVRRLADQQAALRRVATLVAEAAPPSALFAAVASEAGALFGADFSGMLRIEDATTVRTVATWAATGDHPEVPERWTIEAGDPMTLLADAGAPTRVEDWGSIPGEIARVLRDELGVSCSVGCPIMVEGRAWGAIAVHWKEPATATDNEARLGQFADLVATAIANAEARGEVERLADEQAALRRVATLVAEGASPSVVLDAVAAETERALGADAAMLLRYEPDEEATVVARRVPELDRLPPGTRVGHEGENVTSMVRRTGRPARIGNYERARGPIADLARAVEWQVRSAVGAPIVVDGRLWGVIIASWGGERSPPGDAEERMDKFARLLDTAIANADTRDQLMASRARLLTAGDAERRRVVRDLHDGAQQRLVHTIVTLKLARQALENGRDDAADLVTVALEQAEAGTEELRELAHGILPSVLTHGGLRAGVEALASRMPLPVEVAVAVDRLPATVEATAYFVVAEALTNVAKHAHADVAEVIARVEDGTLQVDVRDNGVGGVRSDGSGLVGLGDRLAVLDGRLRVESPADGGTLISAAIPLDSDPAT